MTHFLNVLSIISRCSYGPTPIPSNVITTMETYLSDAFISKIKSKKQFLRSFVETFHDFKKEKFELRDIFTYYEEIEEKVIKAMKDVIYHDLPKVSGMYRDTLGVEFLALSNLYKSVLVRHDLVHRNGKTISGEFHEINRGDVEQLCNQIESFVRDVESKLKAI